MTEPLPEPGAAPSSTYRLQIRPSFDLHAAADLCDYLATLGVGDVYCSPLLPSARGSDHGYDVVRFDGIDPARGGSDGWTRLLAAARARGLGIVVDIVPNHAGVGRAAENPAWWDVLRLGASSPYASWFDIDWTRKPLVPVLGDDFTPSQLRIEAGELRYHEHRFPLAPGTGPAEDESAADVAARQHYELVNFRRAAAEQNYRRFFAITALAGLRVEDPDVFAATHEQVRRWLATDGVRGLRVDHPDGLADPAGYLARLRALAGAGAWLTVEKILAPGETLPPDWPVAGTTGYDALAEVGALFVDPAAEPLLDEVYRSLTGDTLSFPEHVLAGKRYAVETMLQAELARLTRLVPLVEDAGAALAELAVRFPVYRSYLPHGAAYVAAAMNAATAARPDLGAAVAALMPRLTDPADELCVRFQQFTGAVMAKGVEDTAYYRYTRFVALNEVGDDPARFGATVEYFHAAQAIRQRGLPWGMTTVATHDTKRSEDVRARLAVLAEVPTTWTALVRRLMRTVPIPDAPFAYLLWQAFAGAGLIERERMHSYAEKAMRETARSTTWTDPDDMFEKIVHAAVDRVYDDPDVGGPVAELVARITPYGWANSLAQKLVQLTMPGVPDVYQGTELWDHSLVDPDNRRRLDTERLRATLARLDSAPEPPPIGPDGAAKVWLVSRALRLRRDRPELFTGYSPVCVSGPAADHAVAFDRGGAITVATRLPVGLERGGGWGDTSISVGPVCDVISGRRYAGRVGLAELLDRYPVALLSPDR